MTPKKLSKDQTLPSEELVQQMEREQRDKPHQMHGLIWLLFILVVGIPLLILVILWAKLT